MNNSEISIIIPIYNALDKLKICVSSIMRHTDLKRHQLILVDDRSTDPDVLPYLKGLKGARTHVLINEKNQGFSGSVNRGIKYASGDVILLNSDTVVTSGWVEKMITCAQSDESIGTVTPFSNNATLCSVPVFCKKNDMPDGYTIDSYAALIEKNSLREYPTISVAHGFCMYIKREVIDRIGCFDQATFERGYGEENDFCCRAEQVGYRHVLCDDTYIFHSESASFPSEEKRQLMKRHEKILRKRYPEQMLHNDNYVRENPHQYLRSLIDVCAATDNGKKNILYLLHYDFAPDAENSIGGTQFHVKDLTDGMLAYYNIVTAARDRECLRVTVYTQTGGRQLMFPIGPKPAGFRFHDKALERALRIVLEGLKIHMIHVHHVQSLSADVFFLAGKLRIPLLLSLHDVFYLCPQLSLLENGKDYCAGKGKNCASCLKKTMGIRAETDYVTFWRSKWEKILPLCDRLIAPSAFTRDLYLSIYEELNGKIEVVPHGLDTESNRMSAEQLMELSKKLDMKKELKATGNDKNEKDEDSLRVIARIDTFDKEHYCLDGWAMVEGTDSRTSQSILIVTDEKGHTERFNIVKKARPDVGSFYGREQIMSGITVTLPCSAFCTGVLNIRVCITSGEEVWYSPIMKVKGYVNLPKTRKRIAFIGGMNEGKGSRRLLNLLKADPGRYDWFVLGGIGDEKLADCSKKNFVKSGWYDRRDIVPLIRGNQIDLICILSIVPETFCYTLSEAELAGVPVLAARSGALTERVTAENAGFLIDMTADAAEVLRTIDDIFENQENYAATRKNLKARKNRGVSDMCGDYRAIYERLPEVIYAEERSKEIKREIVEAAKHAERRRNSEELEAEMFSRNLLLQFNEQLYLTKNSLTYRAGALFGKLVPCKKTIRAIYDACRK